MVESRISPGVYQQRRGMKFRVVYQLRAGIWYGHDEDWFPGCYYMDGRMANPPAGVDDIAQFDLVLRLPEAANDADMPPVELAEVERLRELLSAEKQELATCRSGSETVYAALRESQQWVADLQSGMYINCVYCGHRYGPKKEQPAQALLAAHIAACEKHPLYKYKQFATKTTDLLHLVRVWLRRVPVCDVAVPLGLETAVENAYQEGLLL